MTVTPPDFDAMYAADPDPWEVASSWYEQRKLGIVLAGLRRPSYGLVWDAACGTGELAARIAPRCETVVATDASAAAVELSRRRVAQAAASNVTVARNALPGRPEVLRGVPDLVVLSEVLYYLDAPQRAATWRLVAALAGPVTDVVAVHWRPRPEDGYRSGEAVQRELNDVLVDAGWYRVVTHTDVEFVMACWSPDVPRTLGR